MSTSLRPRHWPRASYDPRYDPIVDAGPGHNREYAPTYWIGTAGAPPEDDGPVSDDMDADVVVVGSGYTGLSCAIHLAREHGIKANVLEANSVAWGCSTRNGRPAHGATGGRQETGGQFADLYLTASESRDSDAVSPHGAALYVRLVLP